MLPNNLFRYCPNCGATRPAVQMGKPGPLRCNACDFVYYFNPCVAAAAFVFDDAGRGIFLKRDKDPEKGKLTIAGGFVDVGENAEEAVHREVQEELGLTIDQVQYVCSMTNLYYFKEVMYPVCDLIFRAKAVNPEEAAALDGAEDILWSKLDKIDPADLAFESVKKGLQMLRDDPKLVKFAR